ncbi:hypothetical protein AI2623V1_1691 [Klebsiella oxytoca]|nr:Uncharacterised protein [Klebsiella oxytoca]CAA0347430.1 Uncharacterised protein [Klebsiella oxytoca]CAF1964563.1 hypothetical protein AI2623V1_1691 [Klebsiella oxytoca]CAF2855311.1 hypothetical protein AI2945V1_1665 [Klebsiella oxytoca]CAF2866578.1 hypothetical protein AI2946V1_1664 [Klebsiella oxytoca]
MPLPNMLLQQFQHSDPPVLYQLVIWDLSHVY